MADEINPIVDFCKMNSANQINVPKSVRDHFRIAEGETELFEVKFIRKLQPTEEK